jgi:hypothetical protein
MALGILYAFAYSTGVRTPLASGGLSFNIVYKLAEIIQIILRW